MDFDLDADQRLLRDTVRRLASERLAAQARQADQEGSVAPVVLGELVELGLTGILARGDGGAGLGPVEIALVVEELARADAGLAWSVAVHNVATAVLERCGARAESWAAEAARGESWLTWAVVEAAGEPAGAVQAERRGDVWALDGTKRWVPSGHRPAFALTLAGAGGQQALFLVPATSPGLVTRSVDQGLGLRSADPRSWSMAGVELADDHRLCALGDGARLLGESEPVWHLALAALGLGIGRAAVAAAAVYAAERKQFGRAIGEFQAIQWKLADAATAVEAAAVLTWRAAQGGPRFPVDAAMAKLKSAEAALVAADAAVQIHGGYGYTVEFVPERLYRDAQALVATLAPRRTLRQRIAGHLLTDSR